MTIHVIIYWQYSRLFFNVHFDKKYFIYERFTKENVSDARNINHGGVNCMQVMS